MIIVFSELTGFQAITLFSTAIFKDVLGPESDSRNSTIVLCAVNFIASGIAIKTVGIWGRRTLLVLGQGTCAVCLILVGFFSIIEFSYGVLGMIFLFVFVY
jgi:hypothetical protein